ncbi:MAG: universal stress protein [Syntrophomonadaceae bacterium]|jgi:nucleotide-binding universal stress UspA family protein|nr:universal stress protein [Bacillota bacterium]NLM89359.1 universal stress protein [Syntrophomonadaceae bacterium]HQA49245.1 universal stress protein [Syntrophomonadaceae bacterium]HQD90236.1 universal stress protein [Syntrophomonadaceae bacterium]
MAVFENVLIPVDDSEQSVRAVEMAASLVQQGFITNITLFNVYNTGDVDITKLRNQERLDELRAESMRILEMHESTLKGQGIDCSIKRAGGDPASLVIDLVENNKEYDLIIMGNRRINKFQELVFGSVSDKVTRLVKIPVLVIK